MMEIVLKRKMVFRQCVHGRMTIDGERVCDSLEHVDGCLPKGKYRVVIKKEDAEIFGILHILCDESPKARFSVSNGIYGLETGSIAVGEWVYLGFILHTREHLAMLMDRVRQSLKRGRMVTLEII